MGCEVRRDANSITVVGRPLRGIDVDMNAISDTVQTLAVVALFADGPTTIRNVGHIRHKETDRIAALATELRKLGATVDERPDGLTIAPGRLHRAAIDTYNDHRMAMSFALAGLKQPGVRISDPAARRKRIRSSSAIWRRWWRNSTARLDNPRRANSNEIVRFARGTVISVAGPERRPSGQCRWRWRSAINAPPAPAKIS